MARHEREFVLYELGYFYVYTYRSKWHHRVAPLAAQKCVGIDGEDAGKFDEIVANISKLTQAEILAIGSIDCSFRAAAGPSSESELGS